MKKRMLAILLAVMLVTALFPVTGLAADTYELTIDGPQSVSAPDPAAFQLLVNGEVPDDTQCAYMWEQYNFPLQSWDVIHYTDGEREEGSKLELPSTSLLVDGLKLRCNVALPDGSNAYSPEVTLDVNIDKAYGMVGKTPLRPGETVEGISLSEDGLVMTMDGVDFTNDYFKWTETGLFIQPYDSDFKIVVNGENSIKSELRTETLTGANGTGIMMLAAPDRTISIEGGGTLNVSGGFAGVDAGMLAGGESGLPEAFLKDGTTLNVSATNDVIRKSQGAGLSAMLNFTVDGAVLNATSAEDNTIDVRNGATFSIKNDSVVKAVNNAEENNYGSGTKVFYGEKGTLLSIDGASAEFYLSRANDSINNAVNCGTLDVKNNGQIYAHIDLHEKKEASSCTGIDASVINCTGGVIRSILNFEEDEVSAVGIHATSAMYIEEDSAVRVNVATGLDARGLYGNCGKEDSAAISIKNSRVEVNIDAKNADASAGVYAGKLITDFTNEEDGLYINAGDARAVALDKNEASKEKPVKQDGYRSSLLCLLGKSYISTPANAEVNLDGMKSYELYDKIDTVYDENGYAKNVKITAGKGTEVPAAPVVKSADCTSIVLETEPNTEYGVMDSGLWYADGVICGLDSGMTYQVVARRTSAEGPGSVSAPTKASTLPRVTITAPKGMAYDKANEAYIAVAGKTYQFEAKVGTVDVDVENGTFASGSTARFTVTADGKLTGVAQRFANLYYNYTVNGVKYSTKVKIEIEPKLALSKAFKSEYMVREGKSVFDAIKANVPGTKYTVGTPASAKAYLTACYASKGGIYLRAKKAGPDTYFRLKAVTPGGQTLLSEQIPVCVPAK